jgi:hypothetical protein
MVSSGNDSESELHVCARLLRALAHRIRGDLSVITNDLAYIATIVDPAEVERARARCGRISSGLAHIGALSAHGNREVVPLSWLLRIFGVSEKMEGPPGEAQVQVFRGLLEHAAALLRELVGVWDVTWCGDGASESTTLSLHVRDTRDFSEKYLSLGSFAVAQLGERFVVEAGVIDLILRDHRWAVAVVCEDHRATIRLTIPSVRG